MIDTQATPAEVLPPCYRKVAVFDGRVAKYGVNICGHFNTAFVVAASLISEYREDNYHGGIIVPWFNRRAYVVALGTDDETEADALWERAEHWVRTGELP